MGDVQPPCCDYADAIRSLAGERLTDDAGRGFMFRRAAGAILAATCLTMTLAPTATAASDPVVVMIKKNAQLAGGQILVSLRARCEARLSAFELDVTVRQGTAGGSVSIVQAGVVTCDGHWQGVDVPVAPALGSFAPGTSTVDVFLGAFDQVQGDLEGTDSETVKVRP